MKGLWIAAGLALGALTFGGTGSAQAAPLAAGGLAQSLGLASSEHLHQAQVYIERRVRPRRNVRRGPPPRRCREVVTRRVNQFGRVVVSRRVVCNRGRW